LERGEEDFFVTSSGLENEVRVGDFLEGADEFLDFVEGVGDGF